MDDNQSALGSLSGKAENCTAGPVAEVQVAAHINTFLLSPTWESTARKARGKCFVCDTFRSVCGYGQGRGGRLQIARLLVISK